MGGGILKSLRSFRELRLGVRRDSFKHSGRVVASLHVMPVKPALFMHIKSLVAILLVPVLTGFIAGCGKDGAREESAGSGGGGTWEKLVMHPFRDAQGTVLVEMPFPSTWKVLTRRAPNDPTIVGPNGIKVVDFPLQTFLFTSDSRLQQTYRQAGQPLRPMPGVDRVVEQDLVPWAAQRGLRYVRHYEIPEVTRVDQWYNDQLYKAVPMQSQMVAIGTEWESTEGRPYFLLMHLSVVNSALTQTWSYFCSGLEAEPAHFESARKQLIFGLANARYNMAPIMAYNQMEAQKANQSWEAHNARMAQNQAAFEASQREFVNRSTAAHDALMSNWRARNAASDRAHEQFVDTITERTKVVDPTSGQQYKVASGYNHYWMNSEGRYISSDRQDYDPNRDEALNKQRWQELKEVK